MEQPTEENRPNRVLREYQRLERNSRKRVALERRLGNRGVLSEYQELHCTYEEERERKAPRTDREEATLEERLAYDLAREVDSLRQTGDQWNTDIYNQWLDHLIWCRENHIRTDPDSDVYKDLKRVERMYDIQFPGLDE